MNGAIPTTVFIHHLAARPLNSELRPAHNPPAVARIQLPPRKAPGTQVLDRHRRMKDDCEDEHPPEADQ